ncbi:MAG: efflux RND transporter periplasmic adaptor subunit [Chitinivibrionia bacterium]|nr:efflux RND transporter periplasmic adaptor subunit [Chitinivibrionia bacterium]
MKNYIFALAFLIFLLGCKKQQEEIAVEEPFAVNAIIAKKIEIRDELKSAVLLQGIKKAALHSQTTGEISSVSANLGQRVKTGEILLSLENSVQAANLKQATGAVEEAQLIFSASERLFKSKSISEAEFVRNQNNLFVAQTALASAKKAFNDTRIIAPFDGFITMKSDDVQKGNVVSMGSALFSIADISKLKANISLGEKEIRLVKNGSNAKVYVNVLDIELLGVISAVSSGSDSQTGTFLAEAVFNNPDFLVKDGMSGTASIDATETNIGIVVPITSIINNRTILVAKNGKASGVSIEYAVISQGRVLIKKGLSENDTIIVSGISQISDGDAISVNIVE